MSERGRLGLFTVSAAGLAALLVWGMRGLPAFGHFHGTYAVLVSRLAVFQRHATDAVTAVNFDYRAMDTLGEEMILFTSVAALGVLLRELRGEHESPSADPAEEHRFGPSAAVRALVLALLAPLVALAAYVDSHGAISPGGGFQGGVIGAAGLLLVFMGGGYMAMRRLSPQAAMELAEASGAAGYGLLGLGGMIFAAAFFQNFLGAGTPGELVSAGTIPLASMAVGLEVTGAFVLMWGELLDQVLAVRG